MVHVAGLGHADDRVQEQHAVDRFPRPAWSALRARGAAGCASGRRRRSGGRIIGGARAPARGVRRSSRSRNGWAVGAPGAWPGTFSCPSGSSPRRADGAVGRAEDFLRALLLVPLVDFLDRQDGQQLVLGVAQRDVLADLMRRFGSTGRVMGSGKRAPWKPSASRISSSTRW
jgi:hypothetical protein